MLYLKFFTASKLLNKIEIEKLMIKNDFFIIIIFQILLHMQSRIVEMKNNLSIILTSPSPIYCQYKCDDCIIWIK